MRISARNVLKSTVKAVHKGAMTAHVQLDAGGTIISAFIPNEAVDELGLKTGMAASAVVKASDVMVAADRR